MRLRQELVARLCGTAIDAQEQDKNKNWSDRASFMIRVIKNEFQKDPSLKDQLLDVVNSSYTQGKNTLDNSLREAQWLYLLENNSQPPQIDGFFFVHGIMELSAGNKTWLSMYLGLSVLRKDLQGAKAMDPLYDKFIEDASSLENEQNERLLLWLTTANPAVYRIVEKKLSDVRPRREWCLSSDDRDIFKALRQRLGIANSDDAEHTPFLLKGFYSGSEYTEEMYKAIEDMSCNENLRYLSKLGIQARDGDRLLVICHLPPPRRRDNESE